MQNVSFALSAADDAGMWLRTYSPEARAEGVIFSPTSARQHPSYGDCLEVKSEYYQNSSVLGCVTQCSQSALSSTLV